jgi:hypothetical protein
MRTKTMMKVCILLHLPAFTNAQRSTCHSFESLRRRSYPALAPLSSSPDSTFATESSTIDSPLSVSTPSTNATDQIPEAAPRQEISAQASEDVEFELAVADTMAIEEEGRTEEREIDEARAARSSLCPSNVSYQFRLNSHHHYHLGSYDDRFTSN